MLPPIFLYFSILEPNPLEERWKFHKQLSKENLYEGSYRIRLRMRSFLHCWKSHLEHLLVATFNHGEYMSSTAQEWTILKHTWPISR